MPKSYYLSIWNELSPLGKKTIPWDLLRSFFGGAGAVFLETFALLIAVKYFKCSSNQKSLIASAPFVGLGLSFLYVNYFHHFLKRRNLEAALPPLLAAPVLILAGLVHQRWQFAFLAGLFSFLMTLRVPVYTAICRENYRRSVRGQIFSYCILLTVITTAFLAWRGGLYLDLALHKYQWLLFFLACWVFAEAICTSQIPGKPATPEPLANPLSYFKILAHDRQFFYVIVTWFLFGFANLVLLPQRIELLSQERYGFSFSAGTIALITAVLPQTWRCLALIPMGVMFDKINFIRLRILLNIFYMLYMILFFNATSLWQLLIGITFAGFADAGGAISWNLWVTKYSPPEQTSQYMAVNSFFVGVRGVMAPFIGYTVADLGSIQQVSWFATSLVFLSCLLLVPLLRGGAPHDQR